MARLIITHIQSFIKRQPHINVRTLSAALKILWKLLSTQCSSVFPTSVHVSFSKELYAIFLLTMQTRDTKIDRLKSKNLSGLPAVYKSHNIMCIHARSGRGDDRSEHSMTVSASAMFCFIYVFFGTYTLNKTRIYPSSLLALTAISRRGEARLHTCAVHLAKRTVWTARIVLGRVRDSISESGPAELQSLTLSIHTGYILWIMVGGGLYFNTPAYSKSHRIVPSNLSRPL